MQRRFAVAALLHGKMPCLLKYKDYWLKSMDSAAEAATFWEKNEKSGGEVLSLDPPPP